MAFNLKIQGFYLVITDTVTNLESIREKTAQLKFKVDGTKYRFFLDAKNNVGSDISYEQGEDETEFDYADIIDDRTGLAFVTSADLTMFLSGKLGEPVGGGGSGVQSVTGDGVDNTDPINPVLSFPNADQVDDASTTNKFATQAQLDQIATNTSDITTLQTGKEDVFNKNTAFNKDFGTGSNDVMEGDTRTINTTEINTISNQSGTNTGDETTATIQAKRPIKTVNGQTLEGSGNVVISSSPSINSASFISTLSQNVGTLLNGTGTNIQVTLTNVLGPNTLGYTISGGSVVIPAAGWYKVSLKGAINTTTNNRQNTSFVVKRNLIDISGTLVSLYTRNNNNTDGSASAANIIPQFQFSLGDTIGFFAISKGDNNQTSFTVPLECVLTLEFLG